jgi:hypothetical protein
MEGYSPVQPGQAFISKEIEGVTSDGGDAFLSRLENTGDVAKVVVFDTWIRNSDRYPADQQEQDAVSNRDNLFFHPVGGKFQLVVFDHTHCFTGGTLSDSLFDQFLLDDDRIYGYFPEFRDYVNDPDVGVAVGRLRQMNREIAGAVVGSIPADWQVSTQTRQQWVKVICERAELVADLMMEIFPNAGLGL